MDLHHIDVQWIAFQLHLIAMKYIANCNEILDIDIVYNIRWHLASPKVCFTSNVNSFSGLEQVGSILGSGTKDNTSFIGCHIFSSEQESFLSVDK